MLFNKKCLVLVGIISCFSSNHAECTAGVSIYMNGGANAGSAQSGAAAQPAKETFLDAATKVSTWVAPVVISAGLCIAAGCYFNTFASAGILKGCLKATKTFGGLFGITVAARLANPICNSVKNLEQKITKVVKESNWIMPVSLALVAFAVRVLFGKIL